MKQLVLDIVSPPGPSLDNFVPGRNAELLQLLRDISAGRSPECLVYVWGAVGSGKTHLLKAVASAVGGRRLKARYLACNEHHALGLTSEQQDCTVIDDVDRLNETSQIELFNFYNETRENRGILIVSGNEAPARLRLREDLVTRLSWGLVYVIHGLTDEEKSQALIRHAQTRAFELTPDVVNYLMSRVQRDFPTLVATLDALDRYSLETKRPITLPLLREILRGEEGY